MNFKKTEQDIIKAIVRYGGEVKSLAQVINKSQLLENKGIVIAFASDRNYVFLDREKYEWHDNNALAYITEFINLIQYLADNHYITLLNDNSRGAHVIGRKESKWIRPGWIAVEDAIIDVESDMGNWFDSNNQQAYWPSCYSEQELPITRYLDCWFSVNEELIELVNNEFESEEKIRFDKQQRLMWVSIFVSGFIGLVGLIIAIIGILIR